jgi:putative Mg2+ transporter-C (MgtC) family protein
MLLGSLLGIERIIAHKTAGIRTFALVAMASALFVIISEEVNRTYLGLGVVGIQPTYVFAQIVVAIGFLSGGLFLKQDNHVSGLTTASGLWITAAIGAAVGYGMKTIAIFTTLITLFIFTILWFLEKKIKELNSNNI